MKGLSSHPVPLSNRPCHRNRTSENRPRFPILSFVEVSVAGFVSVLDAVVVASLAPLSLWILLSGLDDLFLDMVCLAAWIGRRMPHRVARRNIEAECVLRAPQKRIAIFLPCWQEDAVITQMVETNLGRIEYANYDFFIGVYPNDSPTLDAARALEIRHHRVHLAVCPHDGPTSKADCLNWIYQRMMENEQTGQCRYDVVVTHDAEDVIHPHSLHWINFHIDTHDMVQVPVLPLPTPWTGFTHGVYCDEFAEFQTKDMPGRQILNGFIPSCGVGTGFSRWKNWPKTAEESFNPNASPKTMRTASACT
jgi:bacteriophage N4 adsorption protein B